MKKTLIALFSLAGAAAGATTVVTFGTQSSNPDFVTDALSVNAETTNLTFTLSNSDILTLSPSNSGYKFYSGSDDGTVEKTWSNAAAISDMNKVLGTTFSAADFSEGSSLYYTATGDAGSTSSLTLDINSGKAGDSIIMYITVASRASHTHGFSVTGLDNITLSYAGLNGTSGFGTSGVDGGSIAYDGSNSTLTSNWSPNTESVMIFKVEGTLTDDNIVMNQATTTKNGWQTLSYKIVPEPTTATLSLLALAGLAARRRRR